MQLKTPTDFPQSDPPLSPRHTLPSMYDLPSEDPEEPGLPDVFHYLQPSLLQETFQPPAYPPERRFATGDMNLYFDPHNPLWHKRPDWFAALDVPNLYEERDLRLSYVVWQEPAVPFMVVELLSPGTEKEDLGELAPREPNQPPGKWQVYEQILGIPYYLVFSRYTGVLQAFGLQGGCYQALPLQDQRLWIPSINLGIGPWEGSYRDTHCRWIRCFDRHGAWIPTDAERAEQAYQQADEQRQRADEERQRAEKLAATLRALGVDPDTL